jgi:hypothetical protein
MADLFKKIGEQTFDGLFADIDPTPIVEAGTIRKLGTAATLKRGTILAFSSGSAGDGKLVVLGETPATNETLTAYAILADDYEVGTSNDVVAQVYKTGSFKKAKLTVKTGHTITAAELNDLRNGGIFIKAEQ